MSRTPLLTQKQLHLLRDSLIAFKQQKPNGQREDFFIQLRNTYPEFNAFSDKQLDNQIIAQRRLSDPNLWPTFS